MIWGVFIECAAAAAVACGPLGWRLRKRREVAGAQAAETARREAEKARKLRTMRDTTRMCLDPFDSANEELLGVCPVCGMSDAASLTAKRNGWPVHPDCAEWLGGDPVPPGEPSELAAGIKTINQSRTQDGLPPATVISGVTMAGMQAGLEAGFAAWRREYGGQRSVSVVLGGGRPGQLPGNAGRRSRSVLEGRNLRGSGLRLVPGLPQVLRPLTASRSRCHPPLAAPGPADGVYLGAVTVLGGGLFATFAPSGGT